MKSNKIPKIYINRYFLPDSYNTCNKDLWPSSIIKMVKALLQLILNPKIHNEILFCKIKENIMLIKSVKENLKVLDSFDRWPWSQELQGSAIIVHPKWTSAFSQARNLHGFARNQYFPDSLSYPNINFNVVTRRQVKVTIWHLRYIHG